MDSVPYGGSKISPNKGLGSPVSEKKRPGAFNSCQEGGELKAFLVSSKKWDLAPKIKFSPKAI